MQYYHPLDFLAVDFRANGFFSARLILPHFLYTVVPMRNVHTLFVSYHCIFAARQGIIQTNVHEKNTVFYVVVDACRKILYFLSIDFSFLIGALSHELHDWSSIHHKAHLDPSADDSIG